MNIADTEAVFVKLQRRVVVMEEEEKKTVCLLLATVHP
jgi:hypothetical protein